MFTYEAVGEKHSHPVELVFDDRESLDKWLDARIGPVRPSAPVGAQILVKEFARCEGPDAVSGSWYVKAWHYLIAENPPPWMRLRNPEPA